MFNGPSISGLGLVATGKRSIYSGEEYNRYFDLSSLEGSDPILTNDGDNHDTLRKMDTISKNYKDQTKNIAPRLRGKSLDDTLNNIWTFVYKHIQYVKDNPNREQIRQPLRTWKDRKGDCDCYATFISSILRNLGIPHAYRMAGYDGDYQHVYVVVPQNGKKSSLINGTYYTLDPVVSQYNYEVPFSKKFDRFIMVKQQMLNGLGDAPSCAPHTKNIAYADLLRVSYIEEQGYLVTEKFLLQNLVPFDKYYLNDGAVRYTVAAMHDILPVITKAQATAILASLTPATPGSGTPPGTTTPPPPSTPGTMKKCDWILPAVAGAVAAIILFSGDDKKEKSSVNGLSGTKKLKKQKRKIRTLYA